MTKVRVSKPRGTLGYQYRLVEGATCWSCGNTDTHRMESGFLTCSKCFFVHNWYQTQKALGKPTSSEGQKGSRHG